MVAYKIGRDTANDIVVDDSSVSRCHAELRVSDESCVLVDLDSTNGTCVRENGRWIEIEKASVARDERILLGEVVTTVTALIEKRNLEPKSLGIRRAPASAFTTPGRGVRGDAPPEPAAQYHGEENDHARLVGRRLRPAADRPSGLARRRDAAPRREPEPPSRGPIVYSGIAARVNGTPDAGPNRPDPSLRSRRAEAARSVTSAPRPAGADEPAAGEPGKRKSTPYLQVPASARARRQDSAADASRTSAPAPVHTRQKWLAVAAVGALFAVTAVVTGLRYGGALAGIVGFGADTRADVVAAAPAPKTAPGKAPKPAPVATPAARESWQRFISGPGDDAIRAGARYDDGGAILVGTTAAGLPPSADMWAVRLDPAGKILWRRAFGGAKTDRGLAVAPAKDGGALVAGRAEDHDAAWLVRLDEAGNKRWERKIKIWAKSAASAAVATPDGGFAVLVVSQDTAGKRTQLVRLDAKGDELWRRPLHKDGIAGTGLLAIRDSGFAVVGVRTGDKPTLWAARLDEEGRITWQRSLARTGRDSRAFVRLARRDDLIIATTHMPDRGATGGLLRLVRLDRQGETLWDHTVKARSGVQVNGLFLVKRGIIVAGVEEGETPWVARVDTNGAVVWERRFADLKTGRADAIVERDRGRILVAGRIDRSGASKTGRKTDGLLLFLDRSGRPDD